MNDVKTKIADLKQWAANPRKISSTEKRILQKGVDQYGDLGGVVFNVRNQQLVGGNQRSTVFGPNDEITLVEQHSEPTPQGTVAWGYVLHNGEKFSYREVDWDDTTHAAAGLMANKAGGDWDWSLLTPIMSDLDSLGGLEDLELTGFNQVEWENMLGADVRVKDINRGDETSEWVGMPEFVVGEKEIKLTLVFKTEQDREHYTQQNSLTVNSKHSNQWLCRL